MQTLVETIRNIDCKRHLVLTSLLLNFYAVVGEKTRKFFAYPSKLNHNSKANLKKIQPSIVQIS